MILGTGIDVVSINEFDRLCRDPASRFLDEHFTGDERLYAEKTPGSQVSHLAAHYAAKESLIKALEGAHLFRPPLVKNINYREIEIQHDPEGRPYFLFSGEMLRVVSSLKVKASLSISHDGDTAVAMVVLSPL